MAVATPTIFERLAKGRPTAAKAQETSPEQKLLDFLQRWDKPTIRERDIRNYGPRPRNHENAIRSAETLVKYGWLVPLQMDRYRYARKWQVVQKPIVRPACGSQVAE
jgi:hypothetical protein